MVFIISPSFISKFGINRFIKKSIYFSIFRFIIPVKMMSPSFKFA
ncbi:hypothetical protein HMPREF0080_01826 [Anaeroglobus geminatus F0357]|uniref:Uncharacterized protein n=1 Tax=Anaeroglobus geminatus F0357 TaxID=861450 RepID=G9YJH5_9FIRM|nr:hypothetical protein HMPREF0080_01826 [Anaeroglobus geminatus F0357]